MRLPLSIALALVATVSAANLPASTLPQAESAAPIQQIVVVVEQNHTFDSYFAEYPGGAGFLSLGLSPVFPDGDGNLIAPRTYDWNYVRSLNLASEDEEVLSNSTGAARDAINGGAMNGFVIAQKTRGRDADLAISYQDEASASLLWRLAKNGVLCDNYFSSELGGSLPNTLSLIAGQPHGFLTESKDSLSGLLSSNFQTVFDALSAAGVEWRYYVGRLSEISGSDVVTGAYLSESVSTPSALYWAPILAMSRFWTVQELNDGLADQDQFFRDAALGELPSVSFILPVPTDHPVTKPEVSHQRLWSIVNSVAKSPQWRSTAIFVVWDDWGGSFDHVEPPDDLGMRVPALLISPFARQGTVSSVQLDHRSIFNFIVSQFELSISSSSGAGDVRHAFDFDAPPKSIELLTSDLLPPSPVGSQAQNQITLWLYVSALILTPTLFLVLTWRLRETEIVGDNQV